MVHIRELTKPKRVVAAIFVITGVVLFAVSWQVLPPNWVGFDYDKNSMSIDYSKLYSSGRYSTGVGHEFVRFPTASQTLLFSSEKHANAPEIQARSEDGVVVSLRLTFQYKLLTDKQSLKQLNLLFGSEFERFYIKIAENELQDVASEFTAFESIQKRELMGLEMLSRLNARLRSVFAEVINLQLLNVELPETFTSAIQETVIAQQDAERAVFSQNTARIEAETSIFKAQLDAQIIVTQATASAEAVVLNGDAVARAASTKIAAEADTFRVVSEVFGRSFGVANFTSDDLVAYIWLQRITAAKADKLVVGVDIPAVLSEP